VYVLFVVAGEEVAMPKAGFIVARFSFLVLAASMLGVAMLAAPAVGQPATCSSTTKCFFAVKPVVPSNPTAGASNSFTFTIQNEASPQQLGAVQISVPTGFNFMITGASVAPGASGTASFTSSSALFQNLSVASGATTTLTVSATVPCGSGTYRWGIAAKQSNNFNGSGNNFLLDPNSNSAQNLSGTLTGSCTPSPPCQSGQVCSASAFSSTTGDSITVTISGPVPPGDVVVAGIEGAGSGVSYSCPTYTSSPDVFSFAVFDPSGNPQPVPLTVTVRIDKSVVSQSGHPGASSWQICYASTTPFNANAVQGTYTPSTDPAAATIGGIPFNTGLLLGCPNTSGAPCVQSRNKNMAGDVLVTFLASGDPYGHP
jgi:hypothetical protein